MREIKQGVKDFFARVKQEIPEINLEMGIQRGSGPGLKQLIQEADLLERNPERTKQFLELAEKCRWVGTATEFAYLMSKQSRARKPKKPIGLGISGDLTVVRAFNKLTEGLEWPDAYTSFGVNPLRFGHTNDFMSKITASQRDIVFFVPSRLYSHPLSETTRDEMEWLLENADKATHVWLVFGAYDYVNQDWHDKDGSKLSYEDRPVHMAKMFTKWVDFLFPKKGN